MRLDGLTEQQQLAEEELAHAKEAAAAAALAAGETTELAAQLADVQARHRHVIHRGSGIGGHGLGQFP